MKNPLLYRSAWPESSREASERLLTETLGGTQSERPRRLALAGGFRLLRLFGIDRLDAPAHAAGRGSAGPDDCDLHVAPHLDGADRPGVVVDRQSAPLLRVLEDLGRAEQPRLHIRSIRWNLSSSVSLRALRRRRRRVRLLGL